MSETRYYEPDFITKFEEAKISEVKYLIKDFLTKKGILTSDDKINKVHITFDKNCFYEEEFDGYDGDCLGGICTRYDLVCENLYKVKAKVNEKTIEMEIYAGFESGGDVYVKVKENKQRQKAKKSE